MYDWNDNQCHSAFAIIMSITLNMDQRRQRKQLSVKIRKTITDKHLEGKDCTTISKQLDVPEPAALLQIVQGTMKSSDNQLRETESLVAGHGSNKTRS